MGSDVVFYKTLLTSISTEKCHEQTTALKDLQRLYKLLPGLPGIRAIVEEAKGVSVTN